MGAAPVLVTIGCDHEAAAQHSLDACRFSDHLHAQGRRRTSRSREPSEQTGQNPNQEQLSHPAVTPRVSRTQLGASQYECATRDDRGEQRCDQV